MPTSFKEHHITDQQASDWRKAARGTAYKAGLRSADLDDAEVVGWTAAWKAYERAKEQGKDNSDGYARKAAANAAKNYARDTLKERSELTNHDWGE